MTEVQEDFAALMDAMVDGWRSAMGVRIVRATAEEVVAELEIGPSHLQPLGIVHGGVYCGLIESVASIGASLYAMKRGRYAVGLDNQTSFLHATRAGTLRATARPLVRGRRSHLWEGNVTDSEGRTVATGRVRLLVMEADQGLPGTSPM